jgi:hypothetical protein
MLARIFSPTKSAMQSGRAKTGVWFLEYEPEIPMRADPLMGYSSSSDMRQQIRLEFDTREEAVAYAEKNGIPYRVFEAEERTPKKLSYSDNFRFNRPEPWTH